MNSWMVGALIVRVDGLDHVAVERRGNSASWFVQVCKPGFLQSLAALEIMAVPTCLTCCAAVFAAELRAARARAGTVLAADVA